MDRLFGVNLAIEGVDLMMRNQCCGILEIEDMTFTFHHHPLKSGEKETIFTFTTMSVINILNDSEEMHFNYSIEYTTEGQNMKQEG